MVGCTVEKSANCLTGAVELDPHNPRAYYLKGLLTFHTPRFVGGGKAKAKPWLQRAAEAFDNFNFTSAVAPAWGVKKNAELLRKCGKELIGGD